MERSIKNLRTLKGAYTKKCEPASIVLNLNKFPKIDMIITNNNGKSWGFFSDSGKCTYIGMNNQEMYGMLFSNNIFSLDKVEHVSVISKNSELKRVYEETINDLLAALKAEPTLRIFGKSYFYTSYNSSEYKKKFKTILTTNPLLFLKFVDIFRPVEEISLHQLLYMMLCNIPANTRLTATSVKEFIPHASCKYIRAWFKSYLELEYVRRLINYNYSPEEIEKYRFILSSNVIRTNEDIFSNKKCINFLNELYNEYIYSQSYNRRNYGYYLDYLQVYVQLPDDLKKDFPLIPKKENIEKYHDRITLVYEHNRQAIWELKNKELTNKYLENYYPKAKKLEFEDDNYSIIACPKLSDLTTEGKVLHHCVGTYINSVANGYEYILFLRKKEQLDTPFFTIDVTPELKVRQIHGAYNCNLTEELIPFIDSWAKKFKLDASKYSGMYCPIC